MSAWQGSTPKRSEAACFLKKSAKIIDFRVDETGVYEYN